jgi:hypothetical protein
MGELGQYFHCLADKGALADVAGVARRRITGICSFYVWSFRYFIRGVVTGALSSFRVGKLWQGHVCVPLLFSTTFS